jgi:hypothetical protein
VLTLIRRRLWLGIGLACLIGAGAISLTAPPGKSQDAAGAFFGAGALLLIAALSLCQVLLAWLARRESGKLGLSGLAARNSTRRAGRSLATVALLACGSFLLVAVGAFHLSAGENELAPTSGTGGFALYCRTSVPILIDLNDPAAARKNFGIKEESLAGVHFVPFRLHEGDDASCLNLNRPQQPTVLGVDPGALAGHFAFTETLTPASDPWRLLDAASADGAIPAVADATTLEWALAVKLGDTVTITDERGQVVRLRLVGALNNSILQGSLLISRANFARLFPSSGGDRVFLISCRPGGAGELTRALADRLGDVGPDIVGAPQRLAAFFAVENTYLTIFQALGALGLLLGSAGVGVVVLRNVLERRGELALMRAVGFGKGRLLELVLYEHWWLLALGLLAGAASAAVAVLPALLAPGNIIPYRQLGLTLLGVLATGGMWTLLAAAAAMKGQLLAALRNE